MLWNLTIKAITKRLKEEGGAIQLLLAPFFFSFYLFAKNPFCAIKRPIRVCKKPIGEIKNITSTVRLSLFLTLKQIIMKLIDEITGFVVDICIKIHSTVGPGCFERVYEEILYYELTRNGFEVKRQLLLPIHYERLYIKDAYKLDLLVENRLILELKSVHPLPIVFFKQIRTQLSLLNLKHGMILNFKMRLMKEGVHRVFNNFGEEVLLPTAIQN
jgi:GxxExxY protein